MKEIRITIYGEPASKANSRRFLRPGLIIKSKKALSYAYDFIRQCPVFELMDGELAVDISVWYRTQRPDLDVSLILDLLQGRAYENDRQVREMHLYHFIDRDNPRAEIAVRKRASKQV